MPFLTKGSGDHLSDRNGDDNSVGSFLQNGDGTITAPYKSRLPNGNARDLVDCLGNGNAGMDRGKRCKGLLEGHGREEIVKGLNVSRTVGWFTSLFPVVLPVAKSGQLGEQIKLVKETMRAIPNKGIGYAILKHLTDSEHKRDIHFTRQPEVVFNYLGQYDADLDNELFTLSDLPEGRVLGPHAERMHPLDIYAKIIGGELVIYLNYNRHEYHKTTIDKLMGLYQFHLNAIIFHCIEKKDSELTPSDFVDKKLSLEELDDIMDLIGDL